MMTIRGKSCPSAEIENVHETMLDGERGYAYKGHVSSIFYPSTHWEPVEEWVDIQVKKEDWDRVDSDGGIFMSRTERRYHFGVTWRYPQ